MTTKLKIFYFKKIAMNCIFYLHTENDKSNDMINKRNLININAHNAFFPYKQINLQLVIEFTRILTIILYKE